LDSSSSVLAKIGNQVHAHCQLRQAAFGNEAIARMQATNASNDSASQDLQICWTLDKPI
jgi:hypothetical protein